MYIEAVALVLSEDDDFPIPGIGQIGESEIDEPVLASVWNCGLGAHLGEGKQSSPLAAGKNHRKNVWGSETRVHDHMMPYLGARALG